MTPASDPAQIDLAREAEFTLGHVRFRPSTLEAFVVERREVFEPRIMQVLVALTRRKGDVVTRDELIRDCWGGRVVGEDSINRCIARLRRFSEAEGGFTLETIPRVGYRLLETAAEDVPPAAEPPATAPLLKRLATVRPNRHATAIAGTVLLLLIAGTLVYWLMPSSAPALERIAVLPFDSLSKGEKARFFGDAVAEQIVAVLNDNQVQAVSRDRTAALRGPGRDEAIKALGADFILDGTVQQGSKGLHVTVHLDHASTHATLWTASFDQAEDDTLVLQAQVAAVAVDQVKAALRARRAGNIGDAALSAYLKAQENARLGGQVATMMRRNLLRTVVEQAPDFSPGYSGLAVSTAQLVQYAAPDEAGALRAEARKAADRALALDPANGETYFALSMLIPAQNVAEREALFQKGLKVDPDEPTLNSSLAALLSDEGRFEQALTHLRRAVMLDPLSPRKTAALAQGLANTGQIGEATATINRASKLWPKIFDVWTTRFYIQMQYGKAVEARAILEASQNAPKELPPLLIAALRAYLDAITAKTPAAREAARRAVLAVVQTDGDFSSATVEILASLGALNDAFAMADRMPVQTAGPSLNTEVLFRPTTAPLRADPRFRHLLERHGILAYWAHRRDKPDFCARENAPVCRDFGGP